MAGVALLMYAAGKGKLKGLDPTSGMTDVLKEFQCG